MLTALTLLVGAPLAAIVNVLEPRVGAPDEGLHGKLGGSIGLDRGNEDKLALKGAANVQLNRGAWHALFSTSAEQAVAFDQVTSDKSFAHLRGIWDFADPWSGFAFTQYDRNAFRDLRLRSLAGAGVSRRMWRTGTSELHLGTALMTEYELLFEDEADGEHLRLRSSSFVTLAVAVEQGITLSSTAYVQPRVWGQDAPEGPDVRGLHQLKLEVKLTDHLVWDGRTELTLDSRPPDGVSTWDLGVVSGLGLKF